MHIFSCGQSSLLPVLPQDGAAMTIDGAGRDLLATAHLQISNLTDAEITAAQNGKIEIGLVRVSSRGATFPVVLFKVAGMIFDAPLSIGLLDEDKRERLIYALSSVGSLTRSATWPLTLEAVERTTHMTKSIRIITPSPRFWRISADALLASTAVTEEMQQDMLRRLYSKYPVPSQLFRRAIHVEKL